MCVSVSVPVPVPVSVPLPAHMSTPVYMGLCWCACASVGVWLHPKETRLLMDALDQDGSGEIDEAEFIVFWNASVDLDASIQGSMCIRRCHCAFCRSASSNGSIYVKRHVVGFLT